MSISQNYAIKDLPVAQRPYEKCEIYGAESLSDEELLAVFLRTGVHECNSTQLARCVLDTLPGRNIGGILKADDEKLIQINGIGKVKKIQLLCLSELTQRVIRASITEQMQIFDEPDKIAAFYMNSMRHLDVEEVRLLILNSRNALIHEVIVSKGSFDSASVSPREVYYYALRYKAVGIILLHNHPSGDPTPSSSDLMITKRLKQTGQLIGINFLDHIIIGDNRYISLKKDNYF